MPRSIYILCLQSCLRFWINFGEGIMKVKWHFEYKQGSFKWYLFTQWSRVPEKLTSLQLVKKFPAFYGTQKFITTFTSACYLFLSWVSPIQPPHSTFWRSILILSSHLHLSLPNERRMPIFKGYRTCTVTALYILEVL
jgi:hypothetical protein